MHKLIMVFTLTLFLAACAYSAKVNVPTQLILGETHQDAQSIPAQHSAVYPKSDVQMRLIKVSQHVYYVQGAPGTATENEGFISNAAVIVTSRGIVLFDSLGTPSLGQQLLNMIRGITDKPIVKVIISHYHADHIYGLQVFEDSGAQVIAAKGVEQYLQSNAAQRRLAERRQSLKPWVNQSTRLVSPDRLITRQTTFTVGDIRFKVTPVGNNHSPGDLILKVLPDQVLLVGDLVFEQRLPFVVGGNIGSWLHTLDTMKLNHVKVIIPGHGPASRQPKTAFYNTRAYLKFLRHNMQKAVNNLIPFDEAYNINWGHFRQLKAFKEANRQNAYSVYLSLEAESMGSQ